MSYTESDAKSALLKAKIELMTKSIFVSTVCLNLEHIFVDQGVSTAGTDGLSVYYNINWFMALSHPQRVGLVAHETWHVCFNHMLRVGGRNKEKYNKAGDYVINNMLLADKYELPDDGLWNEDYLGMSTEQVYELLPDDPDPMYIPDIFEPKNATEAAEISTKVTEIIVKARTQSKIASRNAGDIPGEIDRMIDELLNPKLPWQTLLNRFMSGFNKDDYSWSRPNKRFYPDYYLPSQFSQTIENVTVAIDTSGSVTDFEIREILSEIQNIRDVFNPEELVIIDCDSKIQSVSKIKQHEDILDMKLSGGGGTSFNPVMKYCRDNPPTVLIYFTDLYATVPREKPTYPVLWICTDKSHKPMPLDMGETIYIHN